MSHQGGKGTSLATKLNHGIDGVQQLLSHLPKLHWDQHGPHGGSSEDAMTSELLLGLSKVKQLDTPCIVQPQAHQCRDCSKEAGPLFELNNQQLC